MTTKKNRITTRSSPDYLWFVKHDVSNLAGQWIAIRNKKIVKKDKDIKNVLNYIKDMDRRQITITKIPEKNQTLIL